MADSIDAMQDVEQRILEERIKEATKRKAAPPPEPWCDSCGEEINPLRRKAIPDTRLCSDCAALAERRDKKR